MSGGLQGGAEPPAFQRAERQRTADADNQEKLPQVDRNGLSRQDEICQEEVSVSFFLFFFIFFKDAHICALGLEFGIVVYFKFANKLFAPLSG